MRVAPSRHADGQYGWLIALAGAVALIFTLGTPFSYGIFLGPLGDEYALSEYSVSLIFSVHLFASYSLAGVLGVLATRYSPRAVLLVAGGITMLLAPGLYLVESFLGLMIVFTGLGAVLGFVVIVLVSIVPQWFDRHRGLATGVLFVGIGVSLFVMPPIWNFAFEAVGVRDGFFAIVALSAVSFLGAALVCRHPPWLTLPTVSVREIGSWMNRLFRTRRFYLLILGFGFAFAWFYLLAGFGVNYFVHRGLSGAAAAFAFGLIGGLSIVSRLGSGAVADRLGYGRTYLLSLGCAVIGCVLLLAPGLVSIYIAILFFGISLGGVTTLYVPIVLRIYEPDKSMAVIGVFSIGLGITALAAPPAATTLVSSSGSFLPVILLTMLTAVVAMAFIRVGTVSD